MGKPRKVQPVKLISGLIVKDVTIFEKIEYAMSQRFGKVDYKSPVFDFNLTNYYEDEMGKRLKRVFLSFGKLVDPEMLAEIKLFTIKLEEKFSDSGKRRVNIDPGYLTHAKLILASTKNFSHRIYLKHGIFAEITLQFKGRTFSAREWTFPDYRTQNYINTFNRIRDIYKKQI